jgi:hypothetical protein
VESGAYSLIFQTDPPTAHFHDAAGHCWAELFLAAAIDTLEGLDSTTHIERPVVERTASGHRVTVEARSTRWSARRLVFECHPDRLETTTEVEGDGHITKCVFFGGPYSGTPHWGSGRYASGRGFSSVFSPEPSRSERWVRPADATRQLDVLGTGLHGQGHWFFTPPPFCFAMSPQPAPAEPAQLVDGPWMTVGLLHETGSSPFTRMVYEGLEDGFDLLLDYEGQTKVNRRWRSPAVVFQFAAGDPYAAIETYARLMERRTPAVPTPGAAPGWWSEPIFCGWGAQSALAVHAGGAAADHCTQPNYERFLATLLGHDCKPGTIVIDDKWQADYGLADVDQRKWPDLRGFVAERHAHDQRVLLWWKAWDPEGLDPAHCVQDAGGRAVAADPSHPGYRAVLEERLNELLSPQGYDADGLKVDFTARTPSGPSLRRHGDAWGVDLLYQLLEVVYRAAKAAKRDALIVTHSPNPAFRTVTDMIRLNDINPQHPVVAQMTHRARIVQAALPGVLIDTDNWQMPDRRSLLGYLGLQPSLGVPALYYATHLDASGEPLRAADYEAVRAAWRTPARELSA